LKLFLILNENPPGSHDDVHRALNRLLIEKELKSFCVYPFLSRLSEGKSNNEVVMEIIKKAEQFQPTAILWSHTGKLKLRNDAFKILGRLDSFPVMGYWDGDIYEKPYKPLPKEIIQLSRSCDVVFCQGFGEMTKTLMNNGCKDIRYVPAVTDEQRFGLMRQKDSNIIFDVVMIGNYVTSKLPWRIFPGARWRNELADLFYEKLGPRFAVFGDGWKGPYSKGPIPFTEQSYIYHSSRIALGVNNLHAKYYFSDRLPIALSSGVPIVHNYETGYEKIFKPIEKYNFFKTTSEAWCITKNILDKDQSELNEIGLRTHRFALDRLTMKKNIKYMIDVLRSYKLGQKKGNTIEVSVNPWGAIPQLS